MPKEDKTTHILLLNNLIFLAKINDEYVKQIN